MINNASASRWPQKHERATHQMMNDGLTLHLKCQGFTQTAATAIRPQPIAKMILLRMDREIPLRTARSSGIPNKKSHSDDKPNNRNSTRNWIVEIMTYKLRQKHTDLIWIAGNDQPQNSVPGHHASRGRAWPAQGGRPRGQSAARSPPATCTAGRDRGVLLRAFAVGGAR